MFLEFFNKYKGLGFFFLGIIGLYQLSNIADNISYISYEIENLSNHLQFIDLHIKDKK